MDRLLVFASFHFCDLDLCHVSHNKVPQRDLINYKKYINVLRPLVELEKLSLIEISKIV